MLRLSRLHHVTAPLNIFQDRKKTKEEMIDDMIAFEK